MLISFRLKSFPSTSVIARISLTPMIYSLNLLGISLRYVMILFLHTSSLIHLNYLHTSSLSPFVLLVFFFFLLKLEHFLRQHWYFSPHRKSSDWASWVNLWRLTWSNLCRGWPSTSFCWKTCSHVARNTLGKSGYDFWCFSRSPHVLYFV